MHARDYQASAQRLIVHNKRMAAGARRRSNDRQNCNDGANRRIENGRISSASDFVFVCILRSARHTCRHFDALFKFSGHFCVFFQRFSSFIPAPTLPSAPLPVCVSVCPSIHRSVDPCRCGCMTARMPRSRSCRGTPPSPRREISSSENNKYGITILGPYINRCVAQLPGNPPQPQTCWMYANIQGTKIRSKAQVRTLARARSRTHTHTHSHAHTRAHTHKSTPSHARTHAHTHARPREHTRARTRAQVRACTRTHRVRAGTRAHAHPRADTHTHSTAVAWRRSQTYPHAHAHAHAQRRAGVHFAARARARTRIECAVPWFGLSGSGAGMSRSSAYPRLPLIRVRDPGRCTIGEKASSRRYVTEKESSASACAHALYMRRHVHAPSGENRRRAQIRARAHTQKHARARAHHTRKHSPPPSRPR